ncbi:N-acetylglucosaminyldiphosphoundecaprenol N-acetyl-beta-D-mannosaminyltransferase [Catalinimonas alkaloidigena]|uniref:N-acetylglucosaminyldiphosphoundecaprenol N-acetyl-beta-D-mannosaminyltransferase n=1 Tax=Catalinimonas alkaloidigena TaxID=1075417 RepID=A0A1G9J4Y9_9BACT|nr:WecB/TagA/CpsF family glycosyltransferase [Catalinimonas alkaloidigena]SDL32224.1 N-acetylglucosaminyldiphosphoundecaprenol N-acetyl-beta-D-mannosaminyltransferase [Catalinimonas alkaloidigena]
MHTKESRQALRKVDIVGAPVTTAPYATIREEILQLGRERRGYVCFANVHMTIEAHQDPTFVRVLEEATIVSPDGRPLSILMRLLYGIPQERACGMDLLPELLGEAARRGLSVYFYGSTEDVLEALVSQALAQHPDLTIAGTHSPPFRPLTAEEDAAVVEEINASGANLVFVSLGCPKQENWMHQHQHSVQACMLGVGQAFLTYTGREKRLPKWTRDLSLEWAYRLYLEPKRLWRRYLIGNSLFLMLAAKAMLKKRLRPS